MFFIGPEYERFVRIVFSEFKLSKSTLNQPTYLNSAVLAKAINSFSRIGHELYFEAGQNGLTIRTVNDSHTAFAVMTFETGFFTEFKIDRSSTDEFCNKCKVLMKSILGVFRNMRQVGVRQGTLNNARRN